MTSYYKHDEWQIVEEGFDPAMNRESESIFSIGNGYMGQRANFEEHYSGDSLRGSYVAGVYYPDKTRVGWWKNGYPEYFAKVLNAPSWIGIDLFVDHEQIDLASAQISSFIRVLNMKEGYLERRFSLITKGNRILEVNARRFVSMAEPDLGVIRYSVKSVDYRGKIGLRSSIDADVRNEDANYGRKFWKVTGKEISDRHGFISARTLKTGFHVITGMTCGLHINGRETGTAPETSVDPKYISCKFNTDLSGGDECILFKYVSVLSSLNIPVEGLADEVRKRLDHARTSGYMKLFRDHVMEWERIWSASDVVIEGDVAAQQAIRFNIFQLNQTYTGKDERLNIGPKGFTGEKYGGSTYWDTEAFCLPFFLKTADMKVGRNLLLYRYRQLPKAIENAGKLGFSNGAALYPMVTMNGEECHNEWEITFEEIHRNGAIAFAIFNYTRHTGDTSYMADYGLESLIGMSRFWSQRATWSENLKKWVILGVTGPNEYENNINNNWYTNYLAVWTLRYTIENLQAVGSLSPGKLKIVLERTNFNPDSEILRWNDIINHMHFPFYGEKNVFLQQDGFLDKEIKPASTIPKDERPINQHWSWDRILRSCYIKQADVLQGLYVFEDNFDTETIKRNFDFYEPLTVHESSLSASIHSILASRTGNIGKAYELYLRTARLDLDDYNREVADGLHITSMAGTWLSIVEGFGGMRVMNGSVKLSPLIPPNWKSYSFHARFRGILFEVKVSRDTLSVSNRSEAPLKIACFGKDYTVKANDELKLEIN